MSPSFGEFRRCRLEHFVPEDAVLIQAPVRIELTPVRVRLAELLELFVEELSSFELIGPISLSGKSFLAIEPVGSSPVPQATRTVTS